MRAVAFSLLFFGLVANAFDVCPESKPLTLFQKQVKFSALSAKLIQQAESDGNEVTLGEAWRSREVAKFYPVKQNEVDGKGIARSLHTNRLAIDLNLFLKGKFLTRTEDYRRLGEWWEKQSTCDFKLVWGGRFKKLPDGNHFSMEHEGIQ